MEIKIRDKFVDAVIKKIKSQNGSTNNIDELLEKRGVEAKDRKIIIDLALDKIHSEDEPIVLVDSDENASSDFSDYPSLDNKNHDDDSKNTSQNVDFKPNQTSKVDSDILYNLGKDNADNHKKELDSTFKMVIESLQISFKKLPVIILFAAIFSILPIVLTLLKFSTFSNIVACFSALAFLTTTARFISERSGVLDSIKFSLTNFIHLQTTLFLAACALLVIAFGFIFLITFIKIDPLIGTLFVVMSIPIFISLPYSLAFTTMVNEEKFYFLAIANSFSYVKGRFGTLFLKFLGFFIYYCVLIGIILGISRLISNSKIATEILDIITTIFLITFAIAFRQTLYINFSQNANDSDARISIGHKIFLIISPILVIVTTITILVLGYFVNSLSNLAPGKLDAIISNIKKHDSSNEVDINDENSKMNEISDSLSKDKNITNSATSAESNQISPNDPSPSQTAISPTTEIAKTDLVKDNEPALNDSSSVTEKIVTIFGKACMKNSKNLNDFNDLSKQIDNLAKSMGFTKEANDQYRLTDKSGTFFIKYDARSCYVMGPRVSPNSLTDMLQDKYPIEHLSDAKNGNVIGKAFTLKNSKKLVVVNYSEITSASGMTVQLYTK